jgi:hypothetical protein
VIFYLTDWSEVDSTSLAWSQFRLHNWAPRHEAVWRSEGIAPPIVNLDTRWRWVIAVPSGKEFPVPSG